MMGIGDRPVLWHVMRYYAHFGHNEFILCLGHGAASVKQYFMRYEETQSNDFVMAKGGQDIQLLQSDISEWRITLRRHRHRDRHRRAARAGYVPISRTTRSSLPTMGTS